MIFNRLLSNIFIWFAMVMLAGCGGGSGTSTTSSNTNSNGSGSETTITVPGIASASNSAVATGTASPPSNNVTPDSNGSGSGTTITTPVVNVSATSPKELTFSWTGITGATHYKLLKNANGVSGYTQVGADLPGAATTATNYIGVHLHDWINASYIVQACNADVCSSSSAVFTTTAVIAAIGYFKASNTGAGDRFGWSVSLSADGTTLAVGAGGEDSSTTGINSTPDEGASEAGAVYVYSRSGSIWSEQAYIKTSITEAGDEFGWSVSLSADGATLAVGAHGEDSSTTGINSTPNEVAWSSGAAYVFSRSDSSWGQQAYIKASNTDINDNFGYSVSLSADGATLAVGARFEDSSTTGINSTPNQAAIQSGAVYVYSRSGSSWSQQAYIKASNTGVSDEFGRSVSLSGDGATLAVGAYAEDSSTTGINTTPNEDAWSSGAAYVFSRSGSSWIQQAYIKASNTGIDDNFGYSVSLAADGATLAVGAYLEDSSTTGINSIPNEGTSAAGAAYVYSRSDSSWSEQAYVKASHTGVSDQFGRSVTLSADGATLAVGAYLEDSTSTGINSTPDESGNGAGAAYVFTRSGSSWSQQSYVKASNTGPNDGFGMSVSLSDDGTALAVGAFLEDSSTTGVNSTPNDVAIDAGAVYLY